MVAPKRLVGHTVVVIDVLRATTTIAHALAAGACKVIPCLEVDEARRRAEKIGRANVVLGGERGGMLIEGFDLGNSPRAYTTDSVGGRTVVFTTTNGTAALLHCQGAEKIVLGALVNLSAVVEAVSSAERLTIVCAGTLGCITREDIFAAGAIVERLANRPDRSFKLSPTALISRATWQSIASKAGGRVNAVGSDLEAIVAAMRESRGGRDLVRLGLDRDIVDAARVDRLDCLPCHDPVRGVLECP